MKYFNLVTTRDKKVIGEYPQVKSDTKPFEWLLPPINEEIRYDNFLEFEKYFDFILNEKANFTDILDRGSLSWGLVVSNTFKKSISNLILPEHRFYPIKVVKGNEVDEYYWFHFYDNIFRYIDLKASTFEIFNTSNFEVVETLSVTSEVFIRNIQNSFSYEKNMRLKELVFNDEFPKYDLWLNNIWGFGTIVSERFVQIFNESKITGYEITDCKYLK
jgi:hypothetical protein